MRGVNVDIKIVEEAKKPASMNPKKFALWLFMATVFMLFAAWTSAYLVKRGDIAWAEIVIPSLFWVNTVVIIISSATMVWAIKLARRDDKKGVKLALLITTILGLAFVVGQVLAFGQMIDMKEHFTGGPVSHSFVYVLCGAHGLHLFSGVIVLMVILESSLNGKVHSKNMDPIEMCATYWHFLGVLWLYLFGFLLLYR